MPDNTETPRGVSRVAAVMGVGNTDWIEDNRITRAGGKPHNSLGYAAIAFKRALADAGIDAAEIDGVVAGPHTAHERLCEILGINPRWGMQADAVLGMQAACMAINAGMAEVVLLCYGNDQKSASVNYGGANAAGGANYMAYVYHAPWGFTAQGSLYAMQFQRYMYETGFTERDLGEVAVAQRLHSSLNPQAIMQKRITIDEYLASRYVVEPLHLYDYCMINDGGVALILMEAKRAERLAAKQGTHRPVYIQGIGRYDLSKDATNLEPRMVDFYRPAQRRAGEQVFNMAGVGPEDMSALQIYDSFSVHIPLALEGYGYCPTGGAGPFLREHGMSIARGLPVNTHGGHLSESYMQGWGHQIEAVRQLRGTCGARQVPDCRFVHYNSDVAGKAVSIIYGV